MTMKAWVSVCVNRSLSRVLYRCPRYEKLIVAGKFARIRFFNEEAGPLVSMVRYGKS